MKRLFEKIAFMYRLCSSELKSAAQTVEIRLNESDSKHHAAVEPNSQKLNVWWILSYSTYVFIN